MLVGTSLPEYIFIRICIPLLQYPFPIYVLLILVSILAGLPQPGIPSIVIASVFAAGLVAEILYAVFIFIPYKRRLRELARHPALPSAQSRRDLFRRCMSKVPNPEHYLRTWFLGANLKDIKRENVREFILWAFFDHGSLRENEVGGLGEEMEAEVDDYLAEVEATLGHKLEPGRGPAKCLRLTVDDIETRYRSWIFYFLVACLDHITHVILAFSGFQYYAQPRNTWSEVFPPRFQTLVSRRRSPVDGIGYWYRPHEAGADTLPLLFIHGIGVGLWSYIKFLLEINSKRFGEKKVGIIAVEILPISFRMTGAPLDRKEFLEQITRILDQHDWTRFVLTSHSYGSVLTTHLVKHPKLQSRIVSIVLIDPVSLMLHLPDVAYNFTRRRPKRANEWMLWYFASMDPAVAYTLGRHFFWRQNLVWAEELLWNTSEEVGPTTKYGSIGANGPITRQKRKVTACLAECDIIVDSASVAAYLRDLKNNPSNQIDTPTGSEDMSNQSLDSLPDEASLGSHKVDILWFPKLDHAEVFSTKANRKKVICVIRRYTDE
jgi:pimeloyl-ACP methyl ester carboxylesterase